MSFPYSAEKVLAVVRGKGYPVYLDRELDLNIIGIRTNVGGRTHQSRQTDRWDDWIVVIWKEGGRLRMRAFEATTDPGSYYLSRKLAGVFGGRRRTAIMKEGHYPGLWMRGRHRRYSAFRQKAPAWFYVDRDLDGRLDMDPNGELQHAVIYANLHSTRAGRLFSRVWTWSAACQVIRRWSDFTWLRALADRQIEAGIGNSFSYSLLSRKDFL